MPNAFSYVEIHGLLFLVLYLKTGRLSLFNRFALFKSVVIHSFQFRMGDSKYILFTNVGRKHSHYSSTVSITFFTCLTRLDLLHTEKGYIPTWKRNSVVRIVSGRTSQLVEYSVICLVDRSPFVLSSLYTTYFKH